MEDIKKAMGERLYNFRKQNKMTQEQVSELLDISVKHYSELERGLTGISANGLANMHTKLGISLDYLLCGDSSGSALVPEVISIIESMTPTKQQHLIVLLNILKDF